MVKRILALSLLMVGLMGVSGCGDASVNGRYTRGNRDQFDTQTMTPELETCLNDNCDLQEDTDLKNGTYDVCIAQGTPCLKYCLRSLRLCM